MSESSNFDELSFEDVCEMAKLFSSGQEAGSRFRDLLIAAMSPSATATVSVEQLGIQPPPSAEQVERVRVFVK